MAVYSFWDHTTPPANAPLNTTSGNIEVGLQIEVQQSIPLRALWFWSPAGAEALPVDINLLLSSTRLRSEAATWSGPPGSGWVRAAFANSPTLDAGTYLVSVRNDPPWTTPFRRWRAVTSDFWPLSYTLTAGPVIISANVNAGRWNNQPGLPTQTSGNNWLDIEVGDLTVTTNALPVGTVGEPYSAQLQAQGGIGALTWSIADGSLPPGLTLNASTGEITGTPT